MAGMRCSAWCRTHKTRCSRRAHSLEDHDGHGHPGGCVTCQWGPTQDLVSVGVGAAVTSGGHGPVTVREPEGWVWTPEPDTPPSFCQFFEEFNTIREQIGELQAAVRRIQGAHDDGR